MGLVLNELLGDEELLEAAKSIMNEKKTDILGFVGSKASDMAMYMGRISSALGKKTIVVDLTPEREVVRMVEAPFSLDFNEPVGFSGIDVCYGDIKTEGFDYDLVIFDFGSNILNENIIKCDKVYCVFDKFLHTAKAIKNANVSETQCNIAVVRDMFVSKVNAKDFIKDSGKVFFKVYELPSSKEDNIAFSNIELNQLANVYSASEEMSDFIDEQVMELFKLPEKEYRKRIKIAQKQKLL